MTTHYDFGLRYRLPVEEEGFGSLVVKIDGKASQLANIIRWATAKIVKQHPTVLFDGLTMYGSRDT